MELGEWTGSNVSKAKLALWAFWGDKTSITKVMDRECRVAGRKATLALFPRGASWNPLGEVNPRKKSEFAASRCWETENQSSVHRGNKPGEGPVKGSNHRVRPFWVGKESLLCSCIHACIHSYIHLLAAMA